MENRLYNSNKRAVINEFGIVQQVTNYYPFDGVFSTNEAVYAKSPDAQPYKYNGKELDRTHGLDWYDYGARNYDAFLPIFTSIDPHCESYYNVSPYAYCHNNPIMLIDPNGKDDYRFDDKTRTFYLMKKTDDETDRVLNYKHDKKTDTYIAKKSVRMSNIEKGILKNGADYNNKNNIISVGNGGPSVHGVKEFALGLSELIGKEVRGYGYSADGSGDISDILIGRTINNKYDESNGNPNELGKKYKEKYNPRNIVLDFHTHPEGQLGATLEAPEISKDVEVMRKDKVFMPNASFLILYRSSYEMKEYDYTE